ncbi:MAG TPA: hypothetical protein VGN00_20380 [Puia sp.]|jgi:hypothetical protein
MKATRSRQYLVPFLLALFIIFSACNRSNQPSPKSPYYVHCTIDGVDLKFDDGLRADRDNYVSISGETGDDVGQSLNVAVQNSIPGAPPVGLGSFGMTDPGFLLNVDYDSAMKVLYVADHVGGNPDTTNFFTVNITAIDNSTVKGNFSGKIYINNSVAGYPPVQHGPQYKTVTNGTFYAKFSY